MISGFAEGFAPVYDENSRVLVLGSFPSVMSRAIDFYYGNPQNKFWRMLCGYFGEEIPPMTEGKRAFVLAHGVALWDVITACEIAGSSDASIRNEQIADIPSVMEGSMIGTVLCNGSKAYELLKEHFPQYLAVAKKMPSTSPANPRFDPAVWKKALEEGFQ